MKIMKVKFAWYVVGSLLMALLPACVPQDTENRTVFLETGTPAYRIPSPATELSIPMTSTAGWQVENDASEWLHVTPTVGEGSISVKYLTVSIDENTSGTQRTGTLTVRSEGLTRQIEIIQDQRVAPWAVVRVLAETYQTAGAVVMYEENGYLVARSVPLEAGSSFVFMNNDDWLQPAGANEDLILGGPGLVSPNLRVPVGEDPVIVAEKGNYDIFLSQDLDHFFFMMAGTDPSEAEEYVAPAKIWGIVGNIAEAASDVILMEEGDYLVARNVSFLSYSFRLRANNEWNDETDLGLAEAGTVDIHQGIQLISSKDNKLAGRSDSAPIEFEGTEGASYDIYFSEADMMLWIMLSGFMPGDPVPVTTRILAKWKTEVGASYTNTFGTTEGVKDKNPGDGGQYADANDGGAGRITYVQIDKRELDTKGTAQRLTAKDGTPCVYGTLAGDYWLFTAQGRIKASAVIHIAFQMRVQSKGPCYWRMEYFDGTDWVPVRECTTVTELSETFSYHYSLKTGELEPVEETFTVPNALEGIQIRFLCVSNITTSGSMGTAPSTRTVRVAYPYIEATQ